MTDDDLQALLGRLAPTDDEIAPPDTDSAEAEQRRTDTVAAMLRAGRQPTTTAPNAATTSPRLRNVIVFAGAFAAVAALLLALRPSRTPAPLVSSSPGGSAAALGSSAAPSLAVAQASSGGFVVLHGHSALRIPGFSPARLDATDHVVTTAAGGAVIALQGDEALATLSSSSELVLRPSEGTACEVTGGRAHFVVEKRSVSTPFVVRARDVRVVVHGTVFDVIVRPSGEVRVHVDEGLVGVAVVRDDGANGEVLLPAGHDWSSAPAPSLAASQHAPPSSASASRPASVPSPPSPSLALSEPRSLHAPAALSSEGPSSSELAAQNELLRRAAAARHAGDRDAERKTLDEFATRYPAAPGLHDALVASMRAAAEAGDTARARSAASRYIAAFPSGPAREEAARLLR